MTTNTFLRLAVFVIGLPALVGSAFVLPEYGLPVFAVLVIGASALAAWEVSRFFPESARSYPGSAVVFAFLGALLPAVGFVTELLRIRDIQPLLEGIDYNPTAVVVATMLVATAIVFAMQALATSPEDISHALPRAGAHVFVLVYPGLFAWHAARIVSLPEPSIMVIVFLLACYLNDSAAWTTGKLFGGFERARRTRPLFAVSPNKSLAGFVGGFIASVVLVVLVGVLAPRILPGPAWRHALFGALLAVTTIAGDLVESALKRSAEVKDSGDLIPGRGGLLDSIDSPLFSAPFFFYGAVVLLHA